MSSVVIETVSASVLKGDIVSKIFSKRFRKALVVIAEILPVVALAIALAISGQAKAAPVLGKSRGIVITVPGIETSSAKAFATAHDKLLLSDYLEQSRPGDDEDQMLRQKLDRAQRAWLAGNIEDARNEFRALSELSLKADWQTTQREALQIAFLRLAQSSESTSERETWLESGARLYGDLTPNASYFPPPLLNDYQSALKRLQAAAIEINLRDIFSDFRYVLVDGRKFDIAVEPRAKLMSGIHRLTAFSDSHESVTEFMTAGQLRVMRLSPPPLTEGVCEAAAVRSRSALPSHLAVDIDSGEGCSTSKLSGAFDHRGFSTHELQMPQIPTGSETRASGNKTLFWIIGGAILAGAGYAIANHNMNGAPEPTHRSGF